MSFRAVLRKEMKELLMEKSVILGIIIMPLLIFPMIGLTMSLSSPAAQDGWRDVEILFMDMDKGWASHEFKAALNQMGLNPIPIAEGINLSEAINELNAKLLIIIPDGFSQNITNNQLATIQIYYSIERPSLHQLRRTSIITEMLREAVARLGENLASERGIDVSFYRSPIVFSEFMLYQGRVVGGGWAGLMQPMFSIIFGLPIGIFILSITAGTIAAVSVGLEKEAKTLEILLTLPIKRTTLLAAKLLSSVAVAVLGGISFLVGFSFYLSGVLNMVGEASEAPIQVSPGILTLLFASPASLILLSVTVLITLSFTLSIGLLAGILSGDVRGGQQLASLFLTLLFLPPFLLLQFSDISALEPAAQWVLLINPVTHVFLAMESILASNYLAAFTHIVALSIFLSLILGFGVWIFSGERLISLRLKMGRGGTSQRGEE